MITVSFGSEDLKRSKIFTEYIHNKFLDARSKCAPPAQAAASSAFLLASAALSSSFLKRRFFLRNPRRFLELNIFRSPKKEKKVAGGLAVGHLRFKEFPISLKDEKSCITERKSRTDQENEPIKFLLVFSYKINHNYQCKY